MEEQKKEFTGVWIPKELLEDINLKPIDKLLYAEIASFSSGCWKKSEELQQLLGVKKRAFGSACKRLRDLGYISEHRQFGRMYRQSTLSFKQQCQNSTDERSYNSTDEQLHNSTVHIDNTKENTKENKSIDLTSMGETPVFGKPEINEMFEKWNEIVGYELESNKQRNRNACNNLIKKYGVEGLTKLMLGVAKSQNDQYAPRISDFVSLQAKYNDLVAWGKRQTTTRGIIRV